MGLSRDLAFKSIGNNSETCVHRSSNFNIFLKNSLIAWKKVYRKSFKGTIAFADSKDVKIFNKKEEILMKKLKNTENLLISQEKPAEESKINLEKSTMEIEEEKPRLLAFKMDI